MGLIYKPNGEKATPDRNLGAELFQKLWTREYLKESKMAQIMKIVELRRSCGVKPDGKDTVKINLGN